MLMPIIIQPVHNLQLKRQHKFVSLLCFACVLSKGVIGVADGPLNESDPSLAHAFLGMQASFNFMSCGAVAMAKIYAGSDAALTMGLIMAAHLVSLSATPLAI